MSFPNIPYQFLAIHIDYNHNKNGVLWSQARMRIEMRLKCYLVIGNLQSVIGNRQLVIGNRQLVFCIKQLQIGSSQQEKGHMKYAKRPYA